MMKVREIREKIEELRYLIRLAKEDRDYFTDLCWKEHGEKEHLEGNERHKTGSTLPCCDHWKDRELCQEKREELQKKLDIYQEILEN